MDVDILRRRRADEHAPFAVLGETELAPRVGSVRQARRFTLDALAPFDVPETRMDDLVLAVSEAFTNAVEAHNRRGVDLPIAVRCTAAVDAVGTEIEDHAGAGIDLSGWRPRPILARDDLGSDRGWGIQLICELVDVATFESTSDGTLVRLAVQR